MKTSFSILLLFLQNPCFTQQPKWVGGEAFCLRNTTATEQRWGEREMITGAYFKEMLPAFFKRKLSFSALQFNGAKLKWIFTGTQGGITVLISDDSVEIIQRYYNSFGFNRMDKGAFAAKRFPESEFSSERISIRNVSVRSVGVEVGHALGFKLFINDSLISNQLTQIDLSKHQLQADGLAMNACGNLQLPAIEEVKLTFAPEKKHQTIIGFGGITSPVAYNLLGKKGKAAWWQLLKEYNLLMQREYPMGKKLRTDLSNWDSLSEATPHYYGDNFPNGEVSDFGYNKTIQDMGGMVVFEFWQFPDWVLTKSAGKPTGIPDLDKYAAAIVNYCSTAKRKKGKPPAIVGIQNEITQPAEVWKEMTNRLRTKLDSSGFGNVQLHMHNAVTLERGTKALQAFSAADNVWKNIDYTASNLYDYQNHFTNPDGFDTAVAKWNDTGKGKASKQFLSVEMCVNDARYQSGSYKVAFLMGELYHKNMVDLNAASLMYCWLLVNTVQPSFAASRSLFTIEEANGNMPVASSYQLRIFGAFSRHLRKGFQRIGMTSSSSGLLASAYSKDDKMVLILVNRSMAPKKVNLSPFRKRLSGMETASPYQQNEKAKLPAGDFLVIEPGSVVTLF